MQKNASCTRDRTYSDGSVRSDKFRWICPIGQIQMDVSDRTNLDGVDRQIQVDLSDLGYTNSAPRDRTTSNGFVRSDKFRWIDCNDQDGQTLSFLKFGHYPADTLLIACNFSDHLQHRNWGCPHAGTWEVLLDSDSPAYAGQGAGGGTTFNTINQSCNDQPYSLSFSVNRWSVRVLAMTSEA